MTEKEKNVLFESLCDTEELCKYCKKTDYGRLRSYSTPNGYVMCEGRYCEEAFKAWLEENEEELCHLI